MLLRFEKPMLLILVTKKLGYATVTEDQLISFRCRFSTIFDDIVKIVHTNMQSTECSICTDANIKRRLSADFFDSLLVSFSINKASEEYDSCERLELVEKDFESLATAFVHWHLTCEHVDSALRYCLSKASCSSDEEASAKLLKDAVECMEVIFHIPVCILAPNGFDAAGMVFAIKSMYPAVLERIRQNILEMFKSCVVMRNSTPQLDLKGFNRTQILRVSEHMEHVLSSNRKMRSTFSSSIDDYSCLWPINTIMMPAWYMLNNKAVVVDDESESAAGVGAGAAGAREPVRNVVTETSGMGAHLGKKRQIPFAKAISYCVDKATDVAPLG
jgi:hypothetical protein